MRVESNRESSDMYESQNPRRGSWSRPIVGAALAMLYSAAFMYATKTLISPQQGFVGYEYRPAEVLAVLLGVLGTSLIGVLVSKPAARPSAFAIAFLAATVGLPLLWVPVWYGPLDDPRVIELQLATIACFVILSIVPRINYRPIRIWAPSLRLVVGILLLFSGAVILLLVGYYGLRPKLIALDDVYEHRSEYSESINSMGSYLVGSLVNAVLPVLAVIGLHYRKVFLALLGVGGYLLTYSLTGYKSHLVGMLLIVSAYLLVKYFPRAPQMWMALLGAIVALAYAADRLTGGVVWTSLLTRRAITTAGVNTSFFLDYFADAEKFMLRHSVLSWAGESPYLYSPARVIGDYYYGSSETAANANFIADGLANFGWVGALLACLLLAILLAVYDRCTDHIAITLSVPALVMVLIAVSNTAILTAMVTHGALLAGFVVASLPASRQDEDEGNIEVKLDGVQL